MEMNVDSKVLRDLEQELAVDLVPGTEIMIDQGNHHFVKASESSDRVLVPQPSDDPHDPLNWSPTWKFWAIFNALLSTFVQAFGPLSLAPDFGNYIKAFDSNLEDVVQFTGISILVLGFSNFLWVPISSRYGRRPVYILSGLVCLGSCIWRAEAKTYGSFMGACALHGLGAGPTETIAPAVISDIFFLHDRGKYNTLYFATYFGTLMIGPIVSGSMGETVGWRNFWWLNVGILSFTLVLNIFLFPETKWHRNHPAELGTQVSNNSNQILETKQVSKLPSSESWAQGIETAVPSLPQLAPTETAQKDPFLGKGAPSKAQFKLFQPADPHSNVLSQIITPWKLFAFPIVQFAGFVVSWSASVFLAVNLTQAQNFAAPPYLYSGLIIGFFNFALLIGTFIGFFTAGPLSDWISMRMTRRNNGVREPEMRLLAMIPYVLIMILGNIITAVGYQNSWSWKIIVIIGYTCAGIQVAALPAIASTYAVDSYKPVTGAIFVSITVNKNLWGYGLGKILTPWVIKSGYIPPIMTNMALCTLWCLFGVLFWYYGKTFRRWSRNSKVHLA